MWTGMVERGDGRLRLPRAAVEIGAALVDRADAFFAAHPNSEDQLRRIFTLRLATVREGEEPTRRRAPRSEFTDEEWRLVTELADHPNRLLVTATSEAGETHAEVAHEAVFRRWDKLREWIAAEREFLAWRTGLEAARRAWQNTPDSSKSEALLMGVAMTQAQSWLARRRQELSGVNRDFIDQGTRRERKARARARRLQALVYVLLVGIIVGLIGVINEASIMEQVKWYWTMRPYRIANFDQHVLGPEAEGALKPGDAFRECARDCPEMVVMPAGEFMMGSPVNEQGRSSNEDDGNGHQHKVTIAQKLAVSKFDVTFSDWDACVSVGGCPPASDAGWGRGTRPVTYVSWDDARVYAAWLSRMTGKTYRLLTEAEWEYAARAGTQTAYFWGDEIGKDNANCTVAAAGGMAARLHRSELSSPMRLASTIWLATCGNGCRSAITTITTARQRTARHGYLAAIAVAVSSAAVPITSVLSTSARLSASGTPPSTGATTWGSGSGGRLPLEPLRSRVWPGAP
jgi:hypothetical protein